MNEEHSGAKKPFYADIVAKQKRHTHHAEKHSRNSDPHKSRTWSENPSKIREQRPEPVHTYVPRKPFSPPKEGAPVFSALSKDSRVLLDSFPEVVNSVFPLDSKKKQLLSGQIRDLSHELTDERSSRRMGYMNDPAVLSAYIHYYMWWNLVRLTKIFASLPLQLEDDETAVDLGSGPLTVPIALWIARPDLRGKKIIWYCVDISQNALSAGEELFLSFAARTGNVPWQIIRIKGECGVALRRRVSFVASANMFNELFQDTAQPIEAQAKHHAETLISYAGQNSSVLVVEPGIPRCGRFISLLRDSLARSGFSPVAPCPHDGECPFPGLRQGKWCHFAFDTTSAPSGLLRLSEDAGLSKGRAVLSFIYSRRMADIVDSSAEEKTETPLEMVSRMANLFPSLQVRITSDIIKLPDHYTGRYGCSELGIVLVSGNWQAGDYLKNCVSGSLIMLPRPDRKNPERDPKTNALVIRLG